MGQTDDGPDHRAEIGGWRAPDPGQQAGDPELGDHLPGRLVVDWRQGHRTVGQRLHQHPAGADDDQRAEVRVAGNPSASSGRPTRSRRPATCGPSRADRSA
jgi:hypothetical protein